MELQVATGGYGANRRELSVHFEEGYSRTDSDKVVLVVRFPESDERELSFELKPADARRLSNWLDILSDTRTS